jgi:hypothetical protein
MSVSKERKRIRLEILEFCRKPRTLREVKERFAISGISAGNFLSFLWWQKMLIHNTASNSYKRSRRKYPWRG